MVKRVVNGVEVVDVEKRRLPSKHYVYVVNVTWSDGSRTVVYRRYSRFFELQIRILELFPKEGGEEDPSQRMIPYLPGKKIFGRSHIREVAMKRLNEIDDYCKTLIRLPAHISESFDVLQFFQVEEEDLAPIRDEKDLTKNQVVGEVISEPMLLEQYRAIADYKKNKKNEVTLTAGMQVEVVEKNENGWWFVNVDEEQGWVPASFLEPAEGGGAAQAAQDAAKHGEEEKFVTINDYTAQARDEISFEKGVVVEVVQKNFEGWWRIRYQGREGVAPAAYLQYMTAKPVPASNGSEVQVVATAQAAVTDALRSESSPAQAVQDTLSPSQTKRAGLVPRRQSIKVVKKMRSQTGESARAIRAAAASAAIAGSIGESSASKKKPGVPGRKPASDKHAFVACAYQAVGTTELSVDEGDEVEVIERNDTGWWYVDRHGVQGWVPSSSFADDQGSVSPPEPALMDGAQTQFPQAAAAAAASASVNQMKSNTSSAGRDTSSDIKAARPLKPARRPSEEAEPAAVALAIKAAATSKAANSGRDGDQPALPATRAALKPTPGKPSAGSSATRAGAPSMSETGGGSRGKVAAMAASTAIKPPQPAAANVSPAKTKPEPVQKSQPVPGGKKSEEAMSPPRKVRGAAEEKEKEPAPERYRACADYVCDDADSLCFKEGDVLEMVEKNSSGWWFMKMDKQQGWAPSTFFDPDPVEQPKKKKPPQPSVRKPQNAASNGPRASSVKAAIPAATAASATTASKPDSKGAMRPPQPAVFKAPAKPTTPPAAGSKVSAKPTSQPAGGSKAPAKPTSPPAAGKALLPHQTKHSTNPAAGKSGHSADVYVVEETYRAEGKDELSLNVGDEVTVTEKSDTGWWCVTYRGKVGWVPESFLAKKSTAKSGWPKPPAPNKASKRASAAYAGEEGEVSFQAGEKLEIIEKAESGWWFVRTAAGVEGWAPSTFIE